MSPSLERFSLAVIAALTGCVQAPEASPELLESQWSPGPIGLQVTGPVEVGETVTLSVTRAIPGRSVVFVVGDWYAVNAVCSPQYSFACLDVTHPRAVGVARADAAGDASVTVTVPPMADGRIVFFQAVTLGRYPEISAVRPRYKRPEGSVPPGSTPAARAMSATTWWSYRFNPRQMTSTLASFYALVVADGRFHAYGDLGLCHVSAQAGMEPSGSATSCPGCEFTFTADLRSGLSESRAAHPAADCEAHLGATVPQLESFLVAGGWAGLAAGAVIGIDVDYPMPGVGPVAVAFQYTAAGAWERLLNADVDYVRYSRTSARLGMILRYTDPLYY